MAYLVGEIVLFLLAAALIGAAMAWLLRGVRSQARERRLTAEIEATRSARDAAEASARALKTALAELRAEMDRETNRLRTRVAELEALQRSLRAAAPAPEPAQAQWMRAAAGLWRLLLAPLSALARRISDAARRILR
ncbi:MAG: hypothetical protein MUC46_02900 [Desulfobacterales bacterium]|nr:hypothetical protein [Desulfobacterales bacterium]